MTTEEIEDVVRALTTVVENLEASSARQSMQEAFMQVRAHAAEMQVLARDGSPRQRRVEVAIETAPMLRTRLAKMDR